MSKTLSSQSTDASVVRKNFSRAAQTYDQYAHMQRFAAGRLADLAFAKFPNTLDSVAEFGCGTGLLTDELLKRFNIAQYLATDISDEMLAICEQKQWPTHGSLVFKPADAQSYVLDDHPVDMIVSGMTAQWLPFSKTLAHWCRLGRRVAFSTLVDGTLADWKNAFEPEQQRTLRLLTLTELQEIVSSQTAYRAEVVTERFVEEFDDVRDFVHSLKGIGAHASADRRIDSTSVRNALKKFPNGFAAQYEIAFVLIEEKH